MYKNKQTNEPKHHAGFEGSWEGDRTGNGWWEGLLAKCLFGSQAVGGAMKGSGSNRIE